MSAPSGRRIDPRDPEYKGLRRAKRRFRKERFETYDFAKALKHQVYSGVDPAALPMFKRRRDVTSDIGLEPGIAETTLSRRDLKIDRDFIDEFQSTREGSIDALDYWWANFVNFYNEVRKSGPRRLKAIYWDKMRLIPEDLERNDIIISSVAYYNLVDEDYVEEDPEHPGDGHVVCIVWKKIQMYDPPIEGAYTWVGCVFDPSGWSFDVAHVRYYLNSRFPRVITEKDYHTRMLNYNIFGGDDARLINYTSTQRYQQIDGDCFCFTSWFMYWYANVEDPIKAKAPPPPDSVAAWRQFQVYLLEKIEIPGISNFYPEYLGHGKINSNPYIEFFEKETGISGGGKKKRNKYIEFFKKETGL